MLIQKQITGEVQIFDGTELVVSLQETCTFSLNDRLPGIEIRDARGVAYFLKSGRVSELQVLPAAPVPFLGTLTNLWAALTRDFFKELHGSTPGTAPVKVEKWVMVTAKSDLPPAIGGVITLEADTAYFLTTRIDLTGDRLQCAGVCAVLGTTSETAFLESTGLVALPLLFSAFTLVLQNITFENADLAVRITDPGATAALDWRAVNFTNCTTAARIEGASNFVYETGALLHSGGFQFADTHGSIVFSNSFFMINATNTGITVDASSVIARRFRVIYSSFVVGATATGIAFDPAATVQNEGYILDTCSFSGPGTRQTGVLAASNKTLFVNNTGIPNTAVLGQMTARNNAAATVIANTVDFFKVNITTTAGAFNEKFDHADNRLTCRAAIQRRFAVIVTLSFTAGANNIIEAGVYDSTVPGVRTATVIKSTANAAGRAENITIADFIEAMDGDFFEVWVRNTSAATNITVEDFTVNIYEI